MFGTKKENEVRLKVGELTERTDFGRGICRIDAKIMQKLGVKEGDVIEVEGKRKTYAIAVRAYPADVGLNIIRMDGLERRNAGAGIGDFVSVRKANVKEAKYVVIAPAREGIVVHMSPQLMKSNLYMRPLVKGDIIIPNPVVKRKKDNSVFEQFFGMSFDEMLFTPFGDEKFVVVETDPKGPVRVVDTTDIEVKPMAVHPVEERKIPEVTYEDLGGLKDAISKIREMVELPLKHPELFERLGIEPPKGVLLHGPPGCGKTLLAKAVANETDSNFYLINGPEIMSKYYGESEKQLREIFEKAEKNAPSIIFIDEIDSIAPKRESIGGEVERRVVSQLLTLMDGLKGRGQVIVIAATNRPNDIDPALRRPGRFDREIAIGVPNKEGRKEILMIHTRGMPLSNDVNLDELAEATKGFTGADIEVLCKEAALKAMRRILPDIENVEGKISSDILKKLEVTREDFVSALIEVEPSAMREVIVETPKVKWDDIGGLSEAKEEIKEAVEWPLKHSDAFKRIGIEPPKGVLLYGPPGCGKTLLAKAVANESGANFIAIKGPEIFSKWVGESEKAIREVFKRAKQVAPCVIFFDELDSIAPKRGMFSGSHVTESVVNQILAELDGIEKLEKVVVIGATNRPDMIDPALLRPGRFDKLIYIGIPDKEQRKKIFEIHTKKMPLAKDVDLDKLVEKTDGYTGADIAALCKEAGLVALREDIKAKEVKMEHFEKALKKIRKSVTDEDIKKYEGYKKLFK